MFDLEKELIDILKSESSKDNPLACTYLGEKLGYDRRTIKQRLNELEERDSSHIKTIGVRYYYHLKTDGELRSILAKVGIGKDLCLKPIKELSGGERTRVRLALMSMKKSNILILDEPTNHLDPETKLELFDALNEFPGTLILVSHEKDFYDELVDDELYFS